MNKTATRSKLLLGIFTALCATHVSASPITYTSRAAFDLAVGGISNTNEDVLDFDSATAGTLLPSTYQGVGFAYTPAGGDTSFKLGVSHDFPGTSGPNTLRVSNDNGAHFASFIAGDKIDFSFAASHAFGMYIIPSNPSFKNNDINLTFAGIPLSSVDTDVATSVEPNNVAALFVGIVDTSATYTTASLLFGFGPFDIDDIVKTSAVPDGGDGGTGTVPEPTTLALMGLGMVGIALARRKNPKATDK